MEFWIEALPSSKITLFLWCQALHQINIILSLISWFSLSNKTRTHSCPVKTRSDSFGRFQISESPCLSALAFVHVMVAWYPVSSSMPQIVQVGSTLGNLLLLFTWTAKLFVASFQVNIFTLGGVLEFQIVFHKLLSPFRLPLEFGEQLLTCCD